MAKFVSLLISFVLVLIDQVIKKWASVSLQPVNSIDIIPKIVEFRFVLNDGMAFSMLSGQQLLLICVTSVMLIAVLFHLVFHKMTILERSSWILVLGGGIGNLIDRILNGVVIDYINVLFMNFAVFNFADICVCVGVGLLLLSFIMDAVKEKNSNLDLKNE